MDSNDDNTQHIIFTCFPYTTNPTSACGADFNAAGTPTFAQSLINTNTGADNSIVNVYEFVTFTRNTAYVAVQFHTTGTTYNEVVYKLTFSGTSCADYSAAIDTSQVIFISSDGPAANTITGLTAIPNVGLGITQKNVNGIYIVSLNGFGNPTNFVNIGNTAEWKLLQSSIDSLDEPPLFAVSAAVTTKIYRVTNILTEAYSNSTLNLYAYPVDVGRFHIMMIYPGICQESLAGANYNKVHALYINMETKEVDFCTEDNQKVTCGNGFLDPGENCDDGNNRNSDGCSSTCTIELGWRCYNTPFNTRSLCERNQCGDRYMNTASPENEICDDGNQLDGDGCSYDCHTIENGYYCGRIGHACEKVCSNSKVDDIHVTTYGYYAYKEACDDGNVKDGDGTPTFVIINKYRLLKGLHDDRGLLRMPNSRSSLQPDLRQWTY